MLHFFRRKKKVDREIAIQRFLAHCETEGSRLETALSMILENHCSEDGQRSRLSEILARPLVSFRDGRMQPNRRNAFAAHCYAMSVSRGLKAAYETDSIHGQAKVIDSSVARSVTEQEVGSDQVGHAPNPYIKGGGHISFSPDALNGGVASQELALIRRYRRLPNTAHVLSMLCLAFRIVPVGGGIGVEVFEEVPDSRHGDVASFNLVGYRNPEPHEVDEWSNDLKILDAEEVLAPLPDVARAALLESIDQVDPFWPSFCNSHTLSWG